MKKTEFIHRKLCEREFWLDKPSVHFRMNFAYNLEDPFSASYKCKLETHKIVVNRIVDDVLRNLMNEMKTEGNFDHVVNGKERCERALDSCIYELSKLKEHTNLLNFANSGLDAFYLVENEVVDPVIKAMQNLMWQIIHDEVEVDVVEEAAEPETTVSVD